LAESGEEEAKGIKMPSASTAIPSTVVVPASGGAPSHVLFTPISIDQSLTAQQNADKLGISDVQLLWLQQNGLAAQLAGQVHPALVPTPTGLVPYVVPNMAMAPMSVEDWARLMQLSAQWRANPINPPFLPAPVSKNGGTPVAPVASSPVGGGFPWLWIVVAVLGFYVLERGKLL
jgi:hypothetical protein